MARLHHESSEYQLTQKSSHRPPPPRTAALQGSVGSYSTILTFTTTSQCPGGKQGRQRLAGHGNWSAGAEKQLSAPAPAPEKLLLAVPGPWSHSTHPIAFMQQT